jgi:hypothetical protein
MDFFKQYDQYFSSNESKSTFGAMSKNNKIIIGVVAIIGIGIGYYIYKKQKGLGFGKRRR